MYIIIDNWPGPLIIGSPIWLVVMTLAQLGAKLNKQMENILTQHMYHALQGFKRLCCLPANNTAHQGSFQTMI